MDVLKVKVIESDGLNTSLLLPSVNTVSEFVGWIGAVVKQDDGRRLTEKLISAIKDSLILTEDNDTEISVSINLVDGVVFLKNKQIDIREFIASDNDIEWVPHRKNIISKKAMLDGIICIVNDVIASRAYHKGDEVLVEIEETLNLYDGSKDERVLELKSRLVRLGLL